MPAVSALLPSTPKAPLGLPGSTHIAGDALYLLPRYLQGTMPLISPAHQEALYNLCGSQRPFCLPCLPSNRYRQVPRSEAYRNLRNSQEDYFKSCPLCYQRRYPGCSGFTPALRWTDSWHRSCSPLHERVSNLGAQKQKRCCLWMQAMLSTPLTGMPPFTTSGTSAPLCPLF